MKIRWSLIVILGVFSIGLIMAMGCNKQSAQSESQVERGEYLVNLGSCNFCHTPKIMTANGMELNQTRLLSGHPEGEIDTLYTSEAMNTQGQIAEANFHITQWAGPWGISFASNLTPDSTTGIGTWTETDFIQTMRTGRHMGSGRQIQLPMPWDNLGKLTDDDLKAIFAYLKSIKPINNKVPMSTPADEAGITDKAPE